MSEQRFSWQQFEKVPLIGIMRELGFTEIEKILPVYISAGLTTIEITMNTPSAKEIIRFAADKYAGQLNVGAGTVCNKNDLKEALAADAQFIVTPILNEEVIQYCADKKYRYSPELLLQQKSTGHENLAHPWLKCIPPLPWVQVISKM